jgi:hypothetical protein
VESGEGGEVICILRLLLSSTVILSGAIGSQREPIAESKDLLTACAKLGPNRNSHDASVRRENSLTRLCRISASGSFDCVVVRFTDDNFAQDDNRCGSERIHC